jgi:2-polyprenyl-3-methyl-5-hydroxy-6-metoxy-1,4-benzoquinol methylase
VIDETGSQRFAEKMLEVLNHAGLALMTSIGHRTGLFDAMANLPAATSDAIAVAAGLSERYVREWLGAMVTGEIVEFDPTHSTYHLPAEHAAYLTRAAAPNNLAVPCQWVSVLGAIEDQVVDAFRHGQGVPYSAYHRFHEVMAAESEQTSVLPLEDAILPLVPGLPERLARGIDVLDIGCGSGRALIRMAELFTQSRFRGYDFSAEAVAVANDQVARLRLKNIRFEVVDAAAMKDEQAYDLVTAFDAIHDQVLPAVVLANINRALRPDGVFLMQDIGASSHVHLNHDLPLGTLIYTISCMHCMSVSLAGGGAGLGAAWGKELALQMLANAGFNQVRVETLPHDILNYYYVAQRG